jgi:hypothetical protein
MPHDDEPRNLTPAELLELVALDLELRQMPRALIAAVWEGAALHRSSAFDSRASAITSE